MTAASALIVGAGIGGLAAGLALRQAGLRVTILERAAELREIGAGLTIWPNGVAAMRRLGAEAPGGGLRAIRIAGSGGKLLTEQYCGDYARRFGVPGVALHRAALQQTLLAALGAEPVVLGAQVVSVEETSAGPAVTTRDGRRWSAGLVVGADGVHSQVRQYVLADGEPRYTGITVWRGVCELPAGAADDECWTFLGSGGEFGYMPMAGGRAYWFASKHAAAGQAPNPGGHLSELRERCEGWPSPVTELIAASREEDVVRTDIYDRPPVARWSRGAVTLLGDAAHPMTPHMSQGACQALEDAVALGAAFVDPTDTPSALARYELMRVQRANRFVRLSAQTGSLIKTENPLLLGLRNAALRWTPKGLVERQNEELLRLPAYA